MSKREQHTSWIPEDDSLGKASRAANGADGVGAADDRPSRDRQTYYLRSDTIAGVRELAEAHDVGVSKLADFILAHGLDMIAQGELELPIRQVVTHDLEI